MRLNAPVTPRAVNILVRGPNWVGDMVMSTPAFRALRRGFPEARITLLARSELLPLLAGAPWFDALRPLTAHRRGLFAMLREARALRATERFDIGLCLPDSFSSALLFRLAGVARVVGYRRGVRGALLHEAVRLPSRAGPRMLVPREVHGLGLVRALGARACGTELELFITAAEEREAARVLAAHGARAGDAYVVLAPSAGAGPAKCWPPAHFASVAEAVARAGVAPVLLGAQGERARAEAVLAAMPAATRARAINLCGALSLGALKPVVRGARALVANDSGTRHIAVAFGVPCVMLLGPTALEKNQHEPRARRGAERGCRVPPVLQKRVPDRPPLPDAHRARACHRRARAGAAAKWRGVSRRRARGCMSAPRTWYSVRVLRKESA